MRSGNFAAFTSKDQPTLNAIEQERKKRLTLQRVGKNHTGPATAPGNPQRRRGISPRRHFAFRRNHRNRVQIGAAALVFHLYIKNQRLNSRALHCHHIHEFRRPDLPRLASKPSLALQIGGQLCRQLRPQIRELFFAKTRRGHEKLSPLTRKSNYSGCGSLYFSFSVSPRCLSSARRARSCPPSPNAIASPRMEAPKTIETAAITVCRASPSSSSAM